MQEKIKKLINIIDNNYNNIISVLIDSSNKFKIYIGPPNCFCIKEGVMYKKDHRTLILTGSHGKFFSGRNKRVHIYYNCEEDQIIEIKNDYSSKVINEEKLKNILDDIILNNI